LEPILTIERNFAPSASVNEHGRYRWSVVILSSREDIATLCSSIEAALAATRDEPAVVDVMVNGNEPLALQAAAKFAFWPASSSTTLRIWSLGRDKAKAWNAYVHGVWPGAEVAFFVDGYARVEPDALGRLADALDASETALGAAAVPMVGRSASALRARMIAAPQINGSLYALRRGTVETIRSMGFRMPFGLYRLDGLLGSALAFGLDPQRHPWTPGFIAVVPGASWSRQIEHVRSTRDLVNWIGRLTRQALGAFEAQAIRDHLVHRQQTPATLPSTNAVFVWSWIRRNTVGALATIVRHPLSLPMLFQLRDAPDEHGLDAPPTLVAVVGRSHSVTNGPVAQTSTFSVSSNLSN